MSVSRTSTRSSTQLIPSFNAESVGGDTANLTLSARLRGLSPNQTLVLVDGKRRHGSANLHVLSGPFQGAAAPDLDLISPESIKRIEVLEDGAAAQYGSDALAGVINIILKDDDEGISGQRHRRAILQHWRRDLFGLDPYRDEARRERVRQPDAVPPLRRLHSAGRPRHPRHRRHRCALKASLSPQQAALYKTIPGFPYVNKINGNGRSWLTNASYNSGYHFGDIEAYSFGTYSRRIASAYENTRVPDRVIASPVLGVGGTLTTPGRTDLRAVGLQPARRACARMTSRITGGFKRRPRQRHPFRSSARHTATTRTASRRSTRPTGRCSSIRTSRRRRSTTASSARPRLTVNADFTKEIDVGMAGPMTLAAGGEYRKDSYEIGARAIRGRSTRKVASRTPASARPTPASTTARIMQSTATPR